MTHFVVGTWVPTQVTTVEIHVRIVLPFLRRENITVGVLNDLDRHSETLFSQLERCYHIFLI
jgi:hypothetical protein